MTLYEAAYLIGVLLLIGGIAAWDRRDPPRKPRTPVYGPGTIPPDLSPGPNFRAPQMSLDSFEPTPDDAP